MHYALALLAVSVPLALAIWAILRLAPRISAGAGAPPVEIPAVDGGGLS